MIKAVDEQKFHGRSVIIVIMYHKRAIRASHSDYANSCFAEAAITEEALESVCT